MFTEAIIQKLKQNNISVDAEKTKQRTSEEWKAANREDQDTILALSGVARSTIQRAYKTGSISAKLVVPIAQTLNINPYYLTGESDERGECSDEILKALLKTHEYDNLLTELSRVEPKQHKKVKKQDKQPENPVAPKETEKEIEIRFDNEMKAALQEEAERIINGQETTIPIPQAPDEIPVDSNVQAFIDSMNEDDMILLLKSIMLRAKAGGKNAELANRLKLLLIS